MKLQCSFRYLLFVAGSLMHYSMFVFAKNRSLPTVEAIEGNHTVGQRNGLSKVINMFTAYSKFDVIDILAVFTHKISFGKT